MKPPAKTETNLTPPSDKLLDLTLTRILGFCDDVEIAGEGKVESIQVEVVFRCDTGVDHLKPYLTEDQVMDPVANERYRPTGKMMAHIQHKAIAFADVMIENGDDKTREVHIKVAFGNGSAITYIKDIVIDEMMGLDDD